MGLGALNQKGEDGEAQAEAFTLAARRVLDRVRGRRHRAVGVVYPAALGDDASGACAQVFFHSQLAAFLKDHMPNPADMPMPRV